MKKIHLAICMLLIFMATACAVNPVTGKRELSLISEKDEIALGQKTDTDIQAQYGFYADSSLNEYVRKVGMQLSPHTHLPNLSYHFVIIDTPVVNAFAAPGGYIYVTRGILAIMNSEAELAAVLGHELGHVNARHSVKKLSELYLVQLGMTVGSALSKTFAKLSGLSGVGIQLLFLKFSRDDEREADALGVEYARKASYNPAEMVSFFSSLQKFGDLSGGKSLPGFLSTHPLTSERIQNVKSMLKGEDGLLSVERDAYLGHIDNIVFGDDPRQGYAEANTFYHPEIAFSFSFPQDWNLENTPTQIVLKSKDGNAALIIQAEKSQENLRDYAQKKVATMEGRKFIAEEELSINGMPVYQQLCDIVQEKEESLKLRLSFLKKSPYIFTFSAFSTSSKFSEHDPQFGATVGSFKELKDKERLNRQPKRLKLIRANGKDNLREIFQKAGMKEDSWPAMAILNAMELDQIPKENELVKITK